MKGTTLFLKEVMTLLGTGHAGFLASRHSQDGRTRMPGVLCLCRPLVHLGGGGCAAGGCGAPRDVMSKSGIGKAERRREEPSGSQAGGPQVLLTISPRRLRRRGCAKWGFLTHWPQAYYKPPAVLCSQPSSQRRSANIHDPVLTLPCAVQSASVRC